MALQPHLAVQLEPRAYSMRDGLQTSFPNGGSLKSLFAFNAGQASDVTGREDRFMEGAKYMASKPDLGIARG